MPPTKLRRSKRLSNRTNARSIYKPLGISTRNTIATRLVTILPDLSQRGHIQCFLENSFIRVKGEQPESHRYEALSYVWGDQVVQKTIDVNGDEHEVGQNLWAFLNHARANYPRLRIWVDALCINQADTSERNHQVKHMWIIYAQALQVLVWLGLGLEAFDQSLDIAIEYSGMVSSIATLQAHPDILTDICRRHAKIHTISDWYKSLAGFWSLEYWSRAWIQQEVNLARSVMLLSGSRGTNLDILRDVHIIALHEEGMKQMPVTPFVKLALARMTSSQRQTERVEAYQDSPWQVFEIARDLGCVDPRDRVYSQLSLVIDGDHFDVDYNEDSYGLFLRTMFFFRNHFYMPRLFQTMFNLAKSLDLLLVCLSDELRLRACTKQPYRKLLALFSTTGVSFDWSTHQWPERGTKYGASSDDFAMKCPDCGKLVSSSVRTNKFTQLCCPKTPGFKFHMSFAPSSNLGLDDPDSRRLIYHGDFLERIFDQEDPVHTTSGVYLSLATCLLLAQHQILEKDLTWVVARGNDEMDGAAHLRTTCDNAQ